MFVILNKSALVSIIFAKVESDQKEVFSYHVKDRVHIYLNKYYLYLDTILRALHYTSELLKSLKKTFPELTDIYLINDNCVIIEKPYYTIITERSKNIIQSTYEGQLKKLGDALGRVLALVGDYDADNYKIIENWLIKECKGNVDIYYPNSDEYIVANRNILDSYPNSIDKCIYFYNKIISEALASIQMHLSVNEESILINTFLNILCYGGMNDINFHLISNEESLRLRKSTLISSDNVLYKLSHDFKVTKENLKESSLFIDKVPKTIRMKPFNFKRLMTYIDNLYDSCVLYVNTYTTQLFEDLEGLYMNHNFITPKSTYFEDYDFSLCNSEYFESSVMNAIDNFNRIYKTKIMY